MSSKQDEQGRGLETIHFHIENSHQFSDLNDYPRSSILHSCIEAAASFDEKNDIEPMIRELLVDPFETPHGPTEATDILTTHLSRRSRVGLAGFLLKGRSFKTVTPKDISHQVFRLRMLTDLQFAILAYTGTLQDNAREEFARTCDDLQVDYSFIDTMDLARIGIVTGWICPNDGSRIAKGNCQCGYSYSTQELNFFQSNALKELALAHQIGQSAGVVVMPTGSGKTRVAAIDAAAHSTSRVLYVAHTHEILDVAEKEFQKVMRRSEIARGWGKERRIPKGTRVILSTIQSVARDSKHIASSGIDYLVIDEFHHAAARSYRRLLDKITTQFVLGLTATPFRGDQQDVIALCDGNLLVRYELRSGVEAGILTPYRYYGYFDDIDYGNVSRTSRGYAAADLNRALVVPERDAAIIEKWVEMAEGLPTIAFCATREHARRVAASFNDAGVGADVYLGDTPFDQREKVIRDLKSREICVLCAVDVLNEGVDVPFVRCLLFLRPTESKRIFLQQFGRGLRRVPGKDYLLVLDFIGNFFNAHRIPDYIGLDPYEEVPYEGARVPRTLREVLNLPVGCKVWFDERVIDVFAQQVYDPRRATRHNIAQILLWQFSRTESRLGRLPSKKELDRMQILHSGLYELVFGSWRNFKKVASEFKDSPFVNYK